MPFFSDLSFESVCDFLTLPSQSTAQTSCIFQMEYNKVVGYTINMHWYTEEVSIDLGHFYNGKNVYGIFHRYLAQVFVFLWAIQKAFWCNKVPFEQLGNLGDRYLIRIKLFLWSKRVTVGKQTECSFFSKRHVLMHVNVYLGTLIKTSNKINLHQQKSWLCYCYTVTDFWMKCFKIMAWKSGYL